MNKGIFPPKEKWKKHVSIEAANNADYKRRLFSFIAMAIIAVTVLSSLVISNHQIYPLILTITLIFSFFSILIVLLFYLKTKALYQAIVIASFIIFMLIILLVYSGGKDNTALYWLMFSPLVAYSTLGIYKGSALLVAILISILTLLYGPDIGQAVYGDTEKSRFLGSYCIVILFAYINEYFRSQSFATLNTISLEQREKANSDSLTGLPNRRFIDSCLVPKILGEQESFLPMAVIMADIDYFKAINDNFGHDAGDKAIIHVATIAKSKVRNSDIVARFGGEEYLLFFPKTSLDNALVIAEQIRTNLANTPLKIEENTIPMTASFGVAEVNNINYLEQAIKLADQKLYQAKQSGRNRVIG
ncbi:GGDEF domain-containing protein [Thalassotalea piscium]|uniref:diguanylate cyclase n=1 Tax=Thalassotalea piscium TaxID=1230533 RepID=A0A7X0TSC4_9GAMM|nr:diguanylate cyclase [Thalassotalea piscium]MBB6541964.1 diguanylate cyclase (GGDEF)-like protein [Thalassotalea piscium]